MGTVKKNVAIIGAGIAGIAVAIRLAIKGYDVQIFEANSYPGGKLSEIKIGDFRFDAGPSLFTLPELVEELFSNANRNIKDYLEYEKLDLVTKYFYEDGTVINAYSDPSNFANEVESETNDLASSVLKYLERSKIIYDHTADTFIFKPLRKWKTWMNADVAKALLHISDFKLFSTAHEANKEHFKDPRVIQLFDRYITYNGSDPYQAPAILNVIPHLEHNIGAYFPKGGMYEIVKALVTLAEELGVRIYYKNPVARIIMEKNVAKGIEVNGEFKKYDIVISNIDIEKTHKHLLGNLGKSENINKEKSSSALIFYWGINSTFPELSLHNIFFSKKYKNEFEYIFERKELYRDPTIYVFISSKMVDSDAPDGKENWFVMINTPINIGQDWDKYILESKKNILAKLNRILGRDISPLLIAEDIMDPRRLEERTSATAGALYGSNSNSRMSAFLRHQNFSDKIKNLYFCGGTVHPGGGIPLCLASAKIVDQLIADKEK